MSKKKKELQVAVAGGFGMPRSAFSEKDYVFVDAIIDSDIHVVAVPIPMAKRIAEAYAKHKAKKK